MGSVRQCVEHSTIVQLDMSRTSVNPISHIQSESLKDTSKIADDRVK